MTTEKSRITEQPTLTRHLMLTLNNNEVGSGGELVSLLVTIQSVVKNISAAVRRAGIFTLQGAHKSGGSINIQVKNYTSSRHGKVKKIALNSIFDL